MREGSSLKQFEHIAAEELPDRLIDEPFLDPEFVERKYGSAVPIDGWERVLEVREGDDCQSLRSKPLFQHGLLQYVLWRGPQQMRGALPGTRLARGLPAPPHRLTLRSICTLFRKQDMQAAIPYRGSIGKVLPVVKSSPRTVAGQSPLATANGVVSVITINKNNGVGLERTLSSVAAQRGVEIQSIVIDGGSSDRSREVIAQFST